MTVESLKGKHVRNISVLKKPYRHMNFYRFKNNREFERKTRKKYIIFVWKSTYMYTKAFIDLKIIKSLKKTEVLKST